VAAGVAGQREARDRGDRRQRLAAEPHGVEGEEVGGLGELRGGVAREREAELARPDAGAVVDHPDPAAAPAVDLDRDRAGPGVDRVVDQLLDHRGRPLDHLAGRDLVDHVIGQDRDRAGFHGPRI
jgi:hypothetical protein